MHFLATASVLALTATIAIADAQQGSPSSNGNNGGSQKQPLVCNQDPSIPSGLVDFEVQGAKYFLNVANQSILAQPEGKTKWEFRPCSVSGKDGKSPIGGPTDKAGHMVVTGSQNPLVCLHVDYAAHVVDYKPCTFVDDGSQQELYWLYDDKARNVRLAGDRTDGKPPNWAIQLGTGKPPGLAVKSVKGGQKGDQGIIFQFADSGK